MFNKHFVILALPSFTFPTTSYSRRALLIKGNMKLNFVLHFSFDIVVKIWETLVKVLQPVAETVGVFLSQLCQMVFDFDSMHWGSNSGNKEDIL